METLRLQQPLSSIIHLQSDTVDEVLSEGTNLDSTLMDGIWDDEARNHEISILTNRVKLLEHALQEARAGAYQAGYDEGKEMAEIEAKKQFEVLSQEFASDINSLRGQFEETLEHLDKQLVDLSLGIAERVIGLQLKVEEKARLVLLKQVQRILNETATQTRAVVHINPSQINWISNTDVIAQLNVPQSGNMRFVADETLMPGECMLETEDYLIDSSIKARLAILQTELSQSYESIAQQI